MDINNNQQINTFGKGMNTDTSDMYISNELYRYAENLRYITNKGSNSGELRLIEGTKPIDLPEDLMWDSIVAMTSIRDYLIVIGSKLVNNKECFNIWRRNLGEPRGDGQDGWRYLLRGTKGSPTWLPLESRNLSLCGRWESDKNVKLYIADGVHPLMCLRMNNFDEVAAIDDIDDLSVLINYLLPPLKVSISERAGLLKPAKVLYAYTLSDDSGMETSLSILSNTVSLYNNNKGYSIKEDIVTDSAVDIEVKYSSDLNHLTNIRIYRITYRQGGLPPLIELFYDNKRHDDIFIEHIVDTGSSTIKTLSTEEFLAITKLGIIPLEIESKDQYLFLGNVKYTQDLVDELVKDIDCTAQPRYIKLFYDNNCQWDPSYCWASEYTQEFGGIGEYFRWNFTFNDQWVLLDNRTSWESEVEELLNPDRKSLRRGEVYRYGVILYDKHGRPSSPKFVTDVIVPPAWYSDAKNGSFEVMLEIGLDKYKLRSIGVTFIQTQAFPEDKGISGWLIVRVKRNIADKINITLGIMGSPHLIIGGNEKGDDIIDTMNDYASCLLSMQMQWNSVERSIGSNGSTETTRTHGFCIKDLDISIFMSPEVCYQKKEFENILPEAETLKTVNVIQYNIPILVAGSWFIPNGYKEKDTHQHLKYRYSVNGILGADSDDVLTVDSSLELYSSALKTSKLIQKYNLRNTDKFLCERGYDSKDNIDNDDDITPGLCVRAIGGFQWAKFSLNHLCPISINTINASTLNNNVKLSSVSFAESPEYNKMSVLKGDEEDERSLTYKNNASFAGTKSFTDWVMWMYHFFDEATLEASLKDDSGIRRLYYSTATGPTCALLQAKSNLGFGYYTADQVNSTQIFPILIANISRIRALPYGGYYDYSKMNSYKNYFVERENVFSKFTTVDPNDTEKKQLTVYDGDCFVGMFTANVAHNWLDPILFNAPRASTVYTVPLESDINLKATCGDLYPRMLLDEKFHQQDKACMIKYPLLTYVQDKDAYLYNTAYSKEEDLITKSIISYKTTDSNNHDCRIHYSQPKVNGQDPDPWPEFKATNYIDVDDRYGAITGLKLFKDKLLFWQENATGVLTVNEKAITQSANGSDIIIGTSDVMLRYDYLSTVYGMYKYQHSFTESNSALYWWDSYNKELLQYAGQLTPMSKAHGVENYINTTKESTKPHLAYDCDYDEIISNIRNNEVIVFNERANAFTSIYTFNPKFSAVIDGKLYLSNDYSIHKMDSLKVKGESYLFNKKAYPMLEYIVNANSSFVKTFDIQTMGANFYNGDYHYEEPSFGNDNSKLRPLRFKYKTRLNQESEIGGLSVSNREYDYRLDIPRHGAKVHDTKRTATKDWGDRMRGKTMQCELSSISNSTDFSLQYIITKYRMSWS